MRCVNHPERKAEYHCPACEAGLCSDCVEKRSFGSGKITLCKRCTGPSTDLSIYRPAPPFWTRIPEILKYPFQPGGPPMFFVWIFIAILLRAPGEFSIFYQNLFGAGALIIYYGLAVTLFYRVETWTEDGRFGVPDWTEFENFAKTYIVPILHFIAALFSTLWPLPVITLVLMSLTDIHFLHFEGALLYFYLGLVALLAALGLALFPMALLVLGITKNMKLVLNPVFLAAQVIKIRKEYLIAYAMLVALVAPYAVFRTAFTFIRAAERTEVLLPWVGYVVADSVIQLYLFMVAGHVIGYMAYQSRFKLRWWPETEKSREFVSQGRTYKIEDLEPENIQPFHIKAYAVTATAAAAAIKKSEEETKTHGIKRTLSSGGDDMAETPPTIIDDEDFEEDLRRGSYLIDHGNHRDAAELYDRLLASRPDNFNALQGRLRTAFALSEHVVVKELGQRIGQVFVEQHSMEALWEMYRDYRKAMPDFVFRPPEMRALSEWLSTKSEHLESARVLRELAVRWPDDGSAPRALYDCAVVLRDHCDKEDTARSILSAIPDRYPDSEYAEKARKLVALIDDPDGGKGPPPPPEL